jgi:hypothetical protein
MARIFSGSQSRIVFHDNTLPLTSFPQVKPLDKVELDDLHQRIQLMFHPAVMPLSAFWPSPQPEEE